MDKNLKIVYLDRVTAGPINLKERFSKYGEYIEYGDTDSSEIDERIKDVDVVITTRIKLRKKQFEKAEKLKLILVTATGFNHIDVKSANEFGIKVANVSGYSTNSVAQLAITFLLNGLTPVNRYYDEVKDGKWMDITVPDYQKYPIDDVNGKILGIVGFGNIGKRVAQVAEILGMEVMVAKNTEKDNAKTGSVIEKDGFLRYDLDEVLEKCDILTLHVPLTDSTRNLINLEKMKKMKKSAVILNLARGPVINQEDLYFALKNKTIKSAAIDVTSVEPIEKNSKLFQLDNILITPHIAWKSEKSMIKLMDDVEKNLKLFLEGRLEGLK
ncbi:NAD-binding D-isomer specific 2-hydroxyacid dehydrogenase [Leptotrichia hongkongensis]|uniref:NAD-binding D-isomer specific 2-hydroxyacid dehydrogenase n=1 Tax=Leptotrichia hongkongensis TaxID=554406 RepID=A0A510L6S3_9FUSO|nr:NAD(P)-dependent oxidoreductase [Leptotrichia hongkongensis]BBM59694.1 NAD-binding D-isomer specific 2-hydroxyacid dehydrogenase [Leptotrichia hongkongensis]